MSARSDEAGSKKIAEEFAADILKLFGATSLMNTRIYFVSDRSGHKEIWSMNYDGSDQKQFTTYRTITTFPVVSSDGTKIAFTTYPSRGFARSAQPQLKPKTAAENLRAFAETGRKLVVLEPECVYERSIRFHAGQPASAHLLDCLGGLSRKFS